MDPRIEHPHGHIYDLDSHNADLLPAVEGHDDENPHEKSVLKKVKAKAKKIKDTLKKHGHGHGRDHEHHPDERYSPDDHDLDEEDDKDGEMVEDPEVHDGTEFEFVAVGSANIPVETENSGNSGFHFGRLAAAREDTPSPGESHEGKVIKPPIKGIEPNTGQPIFKFENPTVSGKEPHAPQNTPVSPPPGHYDYGTKVTDPTKTFVPGEEGSTGQPKVNLEKPMGLEEDPHAPKDRSEPHTLANYQAKVTDPTGTGGEEAGIATILQSFDKLKVHDEPKPNPTGPDENLPTAISNQFTKSPTGSHDQFSPEPVPSEAKIFRDKYQLPESFDATKLPDDSRDISEEPLNQGSYTEKISSASSAIANKAISAKNAVASKLGYGEKDMTSGTEVRQSGDNAKSSSAEYGKKIAATVSEKLTPVYEKVAEAGSTVISKVHGTGTADTDPGIGNESQSWDVKGQDKGVSVKDYFLEKLRPGDEDRALAEVISDALHKPTEEPGKGKMRPMGEVTESEEVARRLGTKEDNYCQGTQSSDVNNSQAGKGVVDKLKGAVGSWFGIRGESQPQVSPQFHVSSYGDEGIPGSANGDGGQSSPTADKGRRLQEN